MCIKPENGSSEAEDIVVQRRNNNFRMPKNFNQDKMQVVCKNVGRNSMYFEFQAEEVEGSAMVVDDVQIKEETQEPIPRTRNIRREKRSNTEGNPGTAAFVSILLHSLKCRSCDQPSCKKMTMVLKHYQACRHKRLMSSASEGKNAIHQNCKLCQQLLRIVAHHSKYLCQLPPGKQGCPVLMCDTFRIMSNTGIAQTPQMRRRINGTQTKA